MLTHFIQEIVATIWSRLRARKHGSWHEGRSLDLGFRVVDCAANVLSVLYLRRQATSFPMIDFENNIGITVEDYGTVDDFVTVRASTFNANQQLSTRSVQQIQYQSIKNYRFQQISITAESGSGPGGRRFKSSLPDQLFPTIAAHS